MSGMTTSQLRIARQLRMHLVDREPTRLLVIVLPMNFGVMVETTLSMVGLEEIRLVSPATMLNIRLIQALVQLQTRP